VQIARLKEATQQPWREQLIRFAPYIVGGIILVLLPAIVPLYLQSTWTKFVIYALFATSYDLIYGYTGLLSLGHAAYFGAGGYAVALLMFHYGIHSLWIGAPIGVLVAALVAAIFGLVALRVSGLYFLLITFALGQLAYSIAWNVTWFNQPGMHGISSGLTRPDLGIPGFSWSTISFYYFVLVVFLICFFLIYRITNSPFGYALRGIREGEHRMRSLGYNTWLHKYIAFVISGAFSGLAGVLFVYYNNMIVPAHLAVETSFLPMVMVIIGGSGTLLGPIIGALVIVFVQYFASLFTPERWPLILGGILVIAIMYARGGIGIHLSTFWKRIRYRYGSIKS
jgi:branched-chain amino acid transport system permease protein